MLDCMALLPHRCDDAAAMDGHTAEPEHNGAPFEARAAAVRRTVVNMVGPELKGENLE
jgi:hypothetical protein